MSKQKTNKSKVQQTIVPSGVITVGLDIGYGVVKVVTSEGAFGFPSVMGHAREIKFQQETIQQKYPAIKSPMTRAHGLSVISLCRVTAG